MQRVTGIMLVAIATAAMLTGCALGGTRDDAMYSRSSSGLWDADYGLIDWNFPTSQNQPPLEGPKRLHGERTAIGVAWATTSTWPYYERSAASDATAKRSAVKADERGAKSASASDSAKAPSLAAGSSTDPAAGSGNH